MTRPSWLRTNQVVGTAFEYAIGAKWLELLKEIAPGVTRAAVLRDPTFAAGIGQFAAIQAVESVGMELSVIGVHDGDAIERAIAAFARGSNGGLVVTASPFATNHPGVIPALAARYKLPAVYPFRYYGGLISYGPDSVSQYRPAAGYVDRILKSENPYQQRPVTATQSKARRCSPQSDVELMTEKQVLGLKPAPRLEQVGDEHSERAQDRKHRSE